MNQWRPFYFTAGYTRLANIPFQRFFHKTPATCFLSETFSSRKVYSPWHSYLVSRLRFSLQEPLVAHTALCTYIFPCWNLSLHTLYFVLTFFPAGTSRCTRCSSSPLCSSSTDSRHSCGTSTNGNDCTVMVLSNWIIPTNAYSYQAKAKRIK